MIQETVKQLLEKYWNGDTSQEEERSLGTFFSGDEVPEELRKYQALFAWKKKQFQLAGSKKLKAGYEKRSIISFYSVVKIAASVLLVLTMSIGIYTHYEQEKFMDEVFSETYSDPEEALQTTKKVIERVSSVLQLMEDKRIIRDQSDSSNVETIKKIRE
jgi:hypothetical protein